MTRPPGVTVQCRKQGIASRFPWLSRLLHAVVQEVPLSRRKRIAIVALLFVACCLRYQPLVRWDSPYPPGPETVRVALSLVRSGEYADPFKSAPTGPTAHVSPGFPILAAALLAFSGPRWGFALQLAAMLAVSATVSLLPRLARSLGLGWWSGVAAGAFWVVAMPPLYPHFEAPYAALLFVLATLGLLSFLARPLKRQACLLGALVGAALLTLPTGLPPLLVYLAVALRRAGRIAVLAALVAAASVAPWMIRNRLVLGSWVPLRSNLGLELAVSNNDCAKPGLMQNLESGCSTTLHPYLNRREAFQLRQMGEVAYNRMKMKEAFRWIRSHPSAFLKLTAQRIFDFWFLHRSGEFWRTLVEPGFRLHQLVLAVATPMSLFALVLLWREKRLAALIMGAWLFLFPLVYYIVQSSDRYRMPTLWVRYLLAGYLAGQLLQWLNSHWPRATSALGSSRSGSESFESAGSWTT